MSGQSEASFLIQDSRRAQQLRNRTVAERVEKLYSVQIRLTARVAAAGSQDQGQGEWVTVTANGSGDTEKAKRYILSLCLPESVQECESNQQLVAELLSETSKLRDDLEVEFQCVILPSSSQSRVCVQGSKSGVLNTISKIHHLMAPPQQTLHPQPLTTSQSRHSPTSTAGVFSSSSPPLSLSSTNDMEQQNRVSPHRLPNIPTPAPPGSDPLKLSTAEKDDILQMIKSDIEKDGSVLPRCPDSSQREQATQYFVSLNFPREKVEAVVNSMDVGADYDDILKRLNTLNVSSRPVANLSLSRPYTYNGEPILSSNATLRPIVIDGSNVAMRHGNGRVFSCRGILIAVQWFRQRGHKDITVFVPQWRQESSSAEYPITDQEILNQLQAEGTLVFTPSRRIGNKRIVCYDDRFIVRLASETKGVIVSNDNFRDLAEENDQWRKTIEHRLVMFAFVNDIFMVPEDPLGKHGPRLSQLLQMEPANLASEGGAISSQEGPKVCPYAERCTFGKKCRFYHPERDGRLDSSVLTSRSANSSPAPPERRHTGGIGDIQTDSGSHHREHLSPPLGSTGSTSPQKPRTSPTFSPQPPNTTPQTYSQPIREYYSDGNQGGYNKPHFVTIPTTTNNGLSPQPSHHPSPSTPMAGAGTYPSHTFPIANLSGGRHRNVTETIQTCVSTPGGTQGNSDDMRSFVPIAPNPRPLVPPGLVPRGDLPSTYPPMPTPQYHSGSPHDMYQYNRPPSGYQHHSHYQHLHTNPYPPSGPYYMQSGHLSPVKSDYSNPSGHVPSLQPANPSTGNAPYPADQRSNNPLLPHHTTVPNGHDYRPSYQLRAGDAHSAGYSRAASMYVESNVMPQNCQERPGIDRFQSSHSSPELYRNSTFHPPSSGGAQFNWALFKQAQARLPNHEQQIMEVMTCHPEVGLDRLVRLIQQSWSSN